MQSRTTERFPLNVRVFFAADESEIEGEGRIADLSKGGCRIESDTLPPKGTLLVLSIFTPDYSWPMKVERAIVQWTKASSFGVQFTSMQAAQRDRLIRCIMNLKKEAGY